MKKFTRALLTRLAKDKSLHRQMPRGYRLDVAHSDDIPELFALGQLCFPGPDGPSRRLIRHFVTRAHAAFMIFRHVKNDSIAGFVLVEANRGTGTLYSNMICTHPDHRGKGLGRLGYALKSRLLELSGYRRMNAHVVVGNRRGLAMLRGAGFEIVRRIDSHYDDGNSAYFLRLLPLGRAAEDERLGWRGPSRSRIVKSGRRGGKARSGT